MITLTILIIAIPVVLIIALFAKNGIDVEHEIVIKRPARDIFGYIKLLKNQDNYNKWVMTDPERKKEFTGTDGTVGFIYAWDSKHKKAGSAAQEIIKITGQERIDIEIRFVKPVTSKAVNAIELIPLNDAETNVKWIFNGNPHPNYILRVVQMITLSKRAVGKDMQASLANLKGILEK